MIAYITEQGAKIQREGRRLIVSSEKGKQTLFIWKLEQIICVGNVSLTQPAIALLLKENIDTVFLQYNGSFLGRLTSKDPGNVFLRKKQFLLTDDNEACLRIAKPIIQAKILSQATFLSRIKRSKSQAEAGVLSKKIRAYALEVHNARSLEGLRGIEGQAASLYFSGLHLGLLGDFGFRKRVRRPPTDPVNAVLSFLYTILINRCYAAVMQAGLDPQPGILHALSYNRFSLPLDLVEEWRTIIVDALTLALFNTKVLDWEDFYTPEITEEEKEEKDPLELAVMDSLGNISAQIPLETVSDFSGEFFEPVMQGSIKAPMFLTKSSLKRVLLAFSKKMETSFFHPLAQKELTYNQALVFQARELRKSIEDSSYPYIPIYLR